MYTLNKLFIGISALDKIIRLTGYGFKDFTKDHLNNFDTTIIILSVVELFLLSNQSSAISGFRSIRLFRIMRVLRLSKIFKKF